MRQTKAVFLLPVRDTDGRDLTAAIRKVEDAVYDKFGGWRCLGVVTGTYQMPDGRKVVDESQQYAVLFDGDRAAELVEILKAFKAGTAQESVYLEVIPDVDVRLVK